MERVLDRVLETGGCEGDWNAVTREGTPICRVGGMGGRGSEGGGAAAGAAPVVGPAAAGGP
jgi:hypothetical protein